MFFLWPLTSNIPKPFAFSLLSGNMLRLNHYPHQLHHRYYHLCLCQESHQNLDQVVITVPAHLHPFAHELQQYRLFPPQSSHHHDELLQE